MNKRYYYTDPLAAAWMAKHFGVGFRPSKPGSTQIDTSTAVGYLYLASAATVAALENTYPRFYIHPDSLHLLEPQVGDIMQTAMGYYGELIEISGDWLVCFDSRNHRNTFERIIQRNGIAFMFPESEGI